MPGAPGPTELDPVDFLGYVGPWYKTPSPSGDMVVLERSLASESGDTWALNGLIRNEGLVAATRVSVTATLQVSGETRQAVAQVPVSPVRPGEPAPFHIEASVPRGDVSSVKWEVESEPSLGSPLRNLEIQPYWTLPYGERDRYNGSVFADTQELPRPFVFYGRVRNEELVSLDRISAWMAFLDDTGRLIHFGRLTPRSSDPNAPLRPGRLQDVIYVVDDPTLGPKLHDASTALWAVGK
jgi:hypothetical protein